MILYLEKPKATTRTLLELIIEFDKVAEYKINTQKLTILLYTNREIRETIPFTIESKRKKKYLGINIPKETEDLYSENFKILIKEIKDEQTEGKIYHAQYCQNGYTTQGNLQIRCNPYQITKDIFHRTQTQYFKICMETQKQKPKLFKAILRKKNKAGGITFLLSNYVTMFPQ